MLARASFFAPVQVCVFSPFWKTWKVGIAMTPQRYNKLLRAKGCSQATIGNKRCWRRLVSLRKEEEEAERANNRGGGFDGGW